MNEILDLLIRHGRSVVFVVAFLEQIGAPVPAIPVLIVAGALAASAGGSILPLLLLAVAGALVADVIWFFLGRRFGSRVLGFVCRLSLSPDSCVRQTESFFDRWGFASLMFAKFIPGFSIVAPPLAGAMPRARFSRFLLYDGIGAVIWAGISLGVGVIFRGAIGRILEELADLGGWAVVLLASAFVLFVLFKWWERRRLYQTLRMARISALELQEKMTAGVPLVILDVRSAASQNADPRRIPGARMLTAEQMETALRTIEPEEEIVLYCT